MMVDDLVEKKDVKRVVRMAVNSVGSLVAKKVC